MNARKYVGIPYSKGCLDCWGIIVKYYRDELGKDIENFKHCKETGANLSYWISEEIKNGSWKKVECPSDTDIILCVKNGINEHVALYIGNGLILHSIRGYGSRIDKMEVLKRLGYEIEFYSWKGGENGNN